MKPKDKSCCELCMYFSYDEQFDEYECSVSMDEDEMERAISFQSYSCPYYKPGDEYQIVKKQM